MVCFFFFFSHAFFPTCHIFKVLKVSGFVLLIRIKLGVPERMNGHPETIHGCHGHLLATHQFRWDPDGIQDFPAPSCEYSLMALLGDVDLAVAQSKGGGSGGGVAEGEEMCRWISGWIDGWIDG